MLILSSIGVSILGDKALHYRAC